MQTSFVLLTIDDRVMLFPIELTSERSFCANLKWRVWVTWKAVTLCSAYPLTHPSGFVQHSSSLSISVCLGQVSFCVELAWVTEKSKTCRCFHTGVNCSCIKVLSRLSRSALSHGHQNTTWGNMFIAHMFHRGFMLWSTEAVVDDCGGTKHRDCFFFNL